MSEADPRFKVTTPAAAAVLRSEQKEEKRKGGGDHLGAGSAEKKRKKDEDHQMLERARDLRGNRDPELAAKPVPPRADPPASNMVAAPALPANDNELLRDLVLGAWKLRGGQFEDLVTQARRLIGDMRKHKLL